MASIPPKNSTKKRAIRILEVPYQTGQDAVQPDHHHRWKTLTAIVAPRSRTRPPPTPTSSTGKNTVTALRKRLRINEEMIGSCERNTMPRHKASAEESG